jgi:hypothetical protein
MRMRGQEETIQAPWRMEIHDAELNTQQQKGSPSSILHYRKSMVTVTVKRVLLIRPHHRLVSLIHGNHARKVVGNRSQGFDRMRFFYVLHLSTLFSLQFTLFLHVSFFSVMGIDTTKKEVPKECSHKTKRCKGSHYQYHRHRHHQSS